MIYKIFGAIYALIIAISVLIVIALFFLLPRRCGRPVRRCWGRFVLAICGLRVSLRGGFDGAAQLLIINHASVLDIILLEALHPGDLCWLAKKEIAALPVFGHIIKRPRMISVDRENPREFVRSLATARERIAEGRVLAIFPEGTRANGRALGRFKKGAAMLHERLNLRAQPVVIAGSRRAMDSVGGLFVRPFARVIIKPLEPSELSLDELRSLMQAELDALNAELGVAGEAVGDAREGEEI